MKKMGKNGSKSVKGKLVLPLMFALLLLAIIILGILPCSREVVETRKKIGDLEVALKDQKNLLPIYLPLKKSQNEPFPEEIKVNKLEPLKVDDLAGLTEVFEVLARKSDVKLVSVTPQVRSLPGGRELVRVDARMRGEFLTFNTFLNELNGLLFVGMVESLSIDVTKSGHEMSFAVWLAIQ